MNKNIDNQEINKAFNPKEIEEKWYSFWEKGNFFKPSFDKSKKPFSIVMPPPNVTGNLHMGHALYTLQDILVRYKRMQGFDTLWIPGTDHAGISTQTVVEKHLIAKLGKRKSDFSKEDFLSHVWDWIEEKEETILKQLQKIGCSCDWSRLQFTLGDRSNKAVKTIFKKMYDDGLLYRGNYLVNWDPVTQTALADDEVEYEERDSYLWYFKYPIAGKKDAFITVATTRPETMLGDTAIALNPKDPRYKKLADEKIILPIINREIPIIADNHIDPEFGTGFVKITPAHDFNDYQIGRDHNLEMINIMNSDGTINENGKEFEGMQMLTARDAVIEKMKSLGLLEKAEPYKLRVGVSYRSKAIIQPYLSKQWFIKTSAFKDDLISLVKKNKINLIPDHFKQTYFYWINNLRDWCISRQLWWGHQIPVWYNKEDPDKMICYSGEDLPKEVKENPEDWYRDEDVLDTWFSSGLWPFSIFGWPDYSKDYEKFYPTSTLVTGHDILFFWVARMIMLSRYATKKVPFKEVFIHGLIYGKSYWEMDTDGSISYLPYDKRIKYDMGESIPKGIFSKWEKMSKSKGNVIDPIEIINNYGTDAMRFSLASLVTHSRQIDLDRRRFEDYKNFANKIWNAFRFIMQNIDENSSLHLDAKSFAKGMRKDLFTLEDKWILSKTNQIIEKQKNNLENFHIDLAAKDPYDFFWNDFCSYYLESVKHFLYNDTIPEKIKINKQKLLIIILIDVIRLLHPIAPFITEEIFSHVKMHFKDLKVDKKADDYTKKTIKALLSPACIVAPFPKLLSKKDISKKIEKEFSFLQNIIKSIRNIKTEMKIPPKEKILIYFSSSSKSKIKFIKENIHLIYAMTKVKDIFFVKEKDVPKIGSITLTENIKIMIPLPKNLMKTEKIRLEKEKVKLEKENEILQKKLKNKDFIKKAPKNIIKLAEENLNKNSTKLTLLNDKINKFNENLLLNEN